ncbi:Ttc8 [Symbiodinium sp. KB8]|nr:Ttc8 [Symbiodinium sp. KB8]
MDTKLPGLPDPFFSLPVSQPDRLRRVAHKLFNAARAPEKDLEGLGPNSSFNARIPQHLFGSGLKEGRRATLNPFFRAVSRFRQRRWDECIDICTELLEQNPKDQAAWFLKCRALTSKQWIDDVEIDEEGVADLLLDENAVAQAPRPGTSLNRPLTRAESGGGPTQVVRPVSASGRPLTGFARPGTNRPTSSSAGRDVTTAMQGNRPGTSRPLTSMGRLIRLGTASMVNQDGGEFVRLESLDLQKYAQRPAIAKALCDYMLYYARNPRKALELASEATQAVDFKDWWWKARLGKAYYQLGLLRDAEKQFKSALKDEEMITTHLELCKVYLRLDQPNSALDQYGRAAEKFVGETHILIGLARTYDMLNALLRGVSFYKKVLQYDAVNSEAIACLASHHFYTDQPELALRFYRRMLQNGVVSAELWNNMGLCCFYAGQYDLTLSCFERALMLADDDNMADVWYNIGQVAIGVGDLGLAYQAFKIAISVDPNHAESYNNIGVLELRKGNVEQAQAHFATAMRLAAHLFEPAFNGGLLAFKLGEFQDSFELANKALEAYPEHIESKELIKQLKAHFSSL